MFEENGITIHSKRHSYTFFKANNKKEKNRRKVPSTLFTFKLHGMNSKSASWQKDANSAIALLSLPHLPTQP